MIGEITEISSGNRWTYIAELWRTRYMRSKFYLYSLEGCYPSHFWVSPIYYYTILLLYKETKIRFTLDGIGCRINFSGGFYNCWYLYPALRGQNISWHYQSIDRPIETVFSQTCRLSFSSAQIKILNLYSQTPCSDQMYWHTDWIGKPLSRTFHFCHLTYV